jgi:hypothetical protein
MQYCEERGRLQQLEHLKKKAAMLGLQIVEAARMRETSREFLESGRRELGAKGRAENAALELDVTPTIPRLICRRMGKEG